MKNRTCYNTDGRFIKCLLEINKVSMYLKGMNIRIY